MAIKKCVICGNEYSICDSAWNIKVIKIPACSKECRNTKEYKKLRDEYLIQTRGFPLNYKNKEEYELSNTKRTCECGKIYAPTHKTQKFCSAKCSAHSPNRILKGTEIKQCAICGNEYKIYESRWRVQPVKVPACSKECKNTDEYKKLRDEYLIQTKGFPHGYHSKEEYDTAVEFSKIERVCECGKIYNPTHQTQKYCSNKCSTHSLDRTSKIKESKKERYGSETYNNRKKAGQTNIERYGFINPQQNAEVKKKSMETCLKKYGNINHLNSDYYVKLREQALMEKYGVDHYFKRTDLVVKSWQNKFGEEYTNPQQVKEIKDKTIETVRDKYGELLGCMPKEQVEKTCLERYGNKSFFASEQGNMSFENLKKNYGWTDEEIDELAKKKYEHYNSKHPICSASKHSLKYFIPLYEFLLQNGIKDEDIHFGHFGKKEYHLSNGKVRGFYDFCIESLKIIIEFHGHMFHPHVENLNECYKWTGLFNNNTFDVQYARDIAKQELAIEKGYEYAVIWDDNMHEENILIIKEVLNKKGINYV